MKREVRIKEYKRVNTNVTEEQVAELFKAPKYETNWFDAQDLSEVKWHLENLENRNKWDEGKLTIDTILAYNNDKLVHVFNTLDSQDDYLNSVVGKLMDRLEVNLPISSGNSAGNSGGLNSSSKISFGNSAGVRGAAVQGTVRRLWRRPAGIHPDGDQPVGIHAGLVVYYSYKHHCYRVFLFPSSKTIRKSPKPARRTGHPPCVAIKP